MTDPIAVASFGILALNVVGLPVLGIMLRRQDMHRDSHFSGIHAKLDHLDACLDGLKAQVLGATASRADIERVRAEAELALNRLRTEIGQDTRGLHDRLFRLENLSLDRRPEGPR